MIAGKTVTSIDIGLFVIFLLVLVLPFKVKLVEENLEAFLFVMGAAAVTVTSKWSFDLVKLAVEEPVIKGIVPAVLVAGLLFFYGKRPFQSVDPGSDEQCPCRIRLLWWYLFWAWPPA